MRDPGRIDRILAELRAAWMAAPDLRLGQLLTNALPPDRRPQRIERPGDETAHHASVLHALYYLEDEEWEGALRDSAEHWQRFPDSDR